MSYDPTIGEWMETDPAVYDDSMNLYEAFDDNPATLTDPTGLAPTQGPRPSDEPDTPATTKPTTQPANAPATQPANKPATQPAEERHEIVVRHLDPKLEKLVGKNKVLCSVQGGQKAIEVIVVRVDKDGNELMKKDEDGKPIWDTASKVQLKIKNIKSADDCFRVQ